MNALRLLLCLTAFLAVSNAFCRKKSKTAKRPHAAAATYSNDQDILIFGGDEARSITLYNTQENSFQFYATLPLTLPDQYGTTSVIRIYQDLYIMLPKITTTQYFFFNSTSRLYWTYDNFPIGDVEKYCMMYSYNKKQVLFTGGMSKITGKKEKYKAAYILDVESPWNNTDLAWLQTSDMFESIYSHQCCILDEKGIVYGGTRNGHKPRPRWSYFDFDTETWRDETRWRRNKYDRFAGACITDTSNLLLQDYNRKAYILGGRNKTAGKRSIIQIKAKVGSSNFDLKIKKRSKKLKKQHLYAAAAYGNNSTYIFNGRRRDGHRVRKYEWLVHGCSAANSFHVFFVIVFAFISYILQ